MKICMKRVGHGVMSVGVGKVLLGLVLCFGLSSVSVRADQSEPADYQTKKLQLGCGRADDVWNYITHEMGEHTATLKEGVHGRQGETFRMIVMYADTSWFLTFEYFNHQGSANDDVSCIVNKGYGESVWEAMDKADYVIPQNPIGNP